MTNWGYVKHSPCEKKLPAAVETAAALAALVERKFRIVWDAGAVEEVTGAVFAEACEAEVAEAASLAVGACYPAARARIERVA